jgi:hypothetical protein
MQMNEHELLDLVLKAKANFAKANSGKNCSKYSGAVSVEIIRLALRQNGINTSSRDVFIKGVPVEIDFLIVKSDAAPEHGLLYQPEDVLAAFEIKNSGSFGEATIENTKRCFSLIKRSNPKIYCVYITIAERRNFRWAVHEGNLGSPAYTLFWHSGGQKNIRYEPGKDRDWNRLITDLQALNKTTIGRMKM